MTLPTNLSGPQSQANNRSWHEQIRDALPGLSLPAVVEGGTGHLAHHEAIHAHVNTQTGSSLPTTITAGMQNHEAHHNIIHAYINSLGSGTVYNIDGAINDTGSSNVTAAINTWLAGLPDGSSSNPTIARFGVNKTYRIDSSINLIQRSWVYLDGNGSTFTRPNTPSGDNIRHFTFDRCTDLDVRNINVTSGMTWPRTWASITGRSGGDGEYDHAFAFRGCTRALIEDCDYQNIWGDGIYLGVGLAGSLGTSDFTARRVHGRRAARGGLQVVKGSNILFEDCDADIQAANYGGAGDPAGLFALNIEPNNGDSVTNVTFRRCRVGVTRLPGYQVVGDSSMTTAATIDGVTFDDCDVMPSTNAIILMDFRPGIVSTNVYKDHRYANISVTGCAGALSSPDYYFGPQPNQANLYPFVRGILLDGFTCTGNAQPGQSDRLFAYTANCTGVTVSGNTITGYTAQHGTGTVSTG